MGEVNRIWQERSEVDPVTGSCKLRAGSYHTVSWESAVPKKKIQWLQNTGSTQDKAPVWWWTSPQSSLIFLACPSAYRIIDSSSYCAVVPFCSHVLYQSCNYHQGHVHWLLTHIQLHLQSLIKSFQGTLKASLWREKGSFPAWHLAVCFFSTLVQYNYRCRTTHFSNQRPTLFTGRCSYLET